MDYEKAFAYVEEQFARHPEHEKKYGYRNRLEHTKRVYMWAKRLLKTEKADVEIVLTSVIFHDVGYTISPKDHPSHSANICREYLEQEGYAQEFIQRVCNHIMHHRDKEMIYDPNTSIEQILLIEADCLDESGVLSMVRDGLEKGLNGACSYQKVYERMCERKIFSDDYQYHCVTNTGLKIIKEKQRLYKELMKSLQYDLFDEFENEA